jgi:hypothetical protein
MQIKTDRQTDIPRFMHMSQEQTGLNDQQTDVEKNLTLPICSKGNCGINKVALGFT